MERVVLLCVGKLKERFYIDAAAEYTKRLSRFCKLEIIELPEERLPENPSPALIDAALLKEAEAVRKKLPPSSRLVALCVEGRLRSSEELAKMMAAWSCGAWTMLSMSPMTFPHHLARVMLLEQIYRAYQINAGSRYHK